MIQEIRREVDSFRTDMTVARLIEHGLPWRARTKYLLACVDKMRKTLGKYRAEVKRLNSDLDECETTIKRLSEGRTP